MSPLNSTSNALGPTHRMRQCTPVGVTWDTLAVTTTPGSGTTGWELRLATSTTGSWGNGGLGRTARLGGGLGQRVVTTDRRDEGGVTGLQGGARENLGCVDGPAVASCRARVGAAVRSRKLPSSWTPLDPHLPAVPRRRLLPRADHGCMDVPFADVCAWPWGVFVLRGAVSTPLINLAIAARHTCAKFATLRAAHRISYPVAYTH
jgi:hypothetical protein